MGKRKKSRTAKQPSTMDGRNRSAPPIPQVLLTLVVANVGFGTILSWMNSTFGIWDVLGKTVPLSAGVAIISVMIGTWLLDAYCSLSMLALLVALMFCGSGYVGTLITDDMHLHMAAYDSWAGVIPDSGLVSVVAKILMYSVFSVIGFWHTYEPARFLGALAIGTMGPWVAISWFLKEYGKAHAAVEAEATPAAVGRNSKR